jgi:hypothetical protein
MKYSALSPGPNTHLRLVHDAEPNKVVLPHDVHDACPQGAGRVGGPPQVGLAPAAPEGGQGEVWYGGRGCRRVARGERAGRASTGRCSPWGGQLQVAAWMGPAALPRRTRPSPPLAGAPCRLGGPRAEQHLDVGVGRPHVGQDRVYVCARGVEAGLRGEGRGRAAGSLGTDAAARRVRLPQRRGTSRPASACRRCEGVLTPAPPTLAPRPTHIPWLRPLRRPFR